jgi:hypothetical protein
MKFLFVVVLHHNIRNESDTGILTTLVVGHMVFSFELDSFKSEDIGNVIREKIKSLPKADSEGGFWIVHQITFQKIS